jgi:hypothetical protein
MRFFIALVICFVCAGAGSVIGHSMHSVLGVPYSLWHGALGAGVGGGVGGFLVSEISMHYLRPFYADYITNKLG